MGSTSYNSKLRDARWQRKRLEVMDRDNWTCRSCGASGEGVTLNVHHAYYESGKSPWEYPDNTLVTWCETCHKSRHEMAQKINWAAALMNMQAYRGLFESIAIIGMQSFFEHILPGVDFDEEDLIPHLNDLIQKGGV